MEAVDWDVMRIIVLAIGVLAALGLFVLWVRWTELRMLYYPIRRVEATPEQRGWKFEEVWLVAEDGTRLYGWFVPADTAFARARPRLAVLLLHGNAGNIGDRLEKLEILRDLGTDVLLLDYRGYGQSEGHPDEAGTYRDARAGYRHLVEVRGLEPRAIVLFGESLGSAVAAQLATQVEVGGLVLEEAFTSVPDVAQAMFPLLPVRWLIRNRYDTLGFVGRVRAPILILHSRDDEYFPFRHAERLAAAARQATVVELRGGHNDAFLVSDAPYRKALANFLERVAGFRSARDSAAAGPANGPESSLPAR